MPDGNKDSKANAGQEVGTAGREAGFGNSRVISADEYFKRVRHGYVRGCKWSAEDWQKVLAELGKDPIRHAERRFCSLINEDHGDLAGASPGIFIGIQLIHPGEVVPNHRHNSVAIYHTLQGTGFTTVEGVRYSYKRGDTIVCPTFRVPADAMLSCASLSSLFEAAAQVSRVSVIGCPPN